jgi:hypothetical protein
MSQISVAIFEWNHADVEFLKKSKSVRVADAQNEKSLDRDGDESNL